MSLLHMVQEGNFVTKFKINLQIKYPIRYKFCENSIIFTFAGGFKALELPQKHENEAVL